MIVITNMSNGMLLLLLLPSHFSRVRLCVTSWMATTRFLHPWDSPGKNTGLGCHFLLQRIMHAKSLQLCPTLCNPVDSSPPGSCVHGIL